MTQNAANPPDPRSESPLPADACIILSECLPSDVQLVDPMVQRVMDSLAEYGCSERQSIAAELALREALANAMLHGNGGDPKKRVEVACMRHEDGSITLMVRDEGAGFQLDAVRDPTNPENLYRPGGRGIYLIRHFMDDVEFRRNGAEIRMLKRKE